MDDKPYHMSEGVSMSSLIKMCKNLDIFPTLISHRWIENFFNDEGDQNGKELLDFTSFLRFFISVADHVFDENPMEQLYKHIEEPASSTYCVMLRGKKGRKMMSGRGPRKTVKDNTRRRDEEPHHVRGQNQSMNYGRPREDLRRSKAQ